MMLSWLKKRRRMKLLAEPCAETWWGTVKRNFALFSTLTTEEQNRLFNDARIFAAEKNWEACGGQELTDEVKLTIAAQACFLTLAMDHDYYPNVLTVLVYPDKFITKEIDYSGRIDEGGEGWGEAWPGGPVILAWAVVLSDGRNTKGGRNLVFHEFAHKLDMADSMSDGAPILETRADYRRWYEVMSREFEALQGHAEEGHRTFLDQYGAEDPVEFFAVCTEAFFTKPHKMLQKHSTLYEVLRDYYCQDPAGRFPRG